jgi:hypothetical protein
MQQLILALHVDEVVPGSQEREELLAGPGHVIAVVGKAAQAVFKCRFRGSDDVLIRGGPVGNCGLTAFDDECDLAELNDVALMERVFAGTHANAIDVGPVRAFEVAHKPTFVSESNLCVAAADGAIVENDFQRGKAAGAQECLGLPGAPFDFATDPTEPDRAFHACLDMQHIKVATNADGLSDRSRVVQNNP